MTDKSTEERARELRLEVRGGLNALIAKLPHNAAEHVLPSPTGCIRCQFEAALAAATQDGELRAALDKELKWLEQEWPSVPKTGVVEDWVLWAFGLDQYHRAHMAELRREIRTLEAQAKVCLLCGVPADECTNSLHREAEAHWAQASGKAGE
jgi:hypothetical protein